MSAEADGEDASKADDADAAEADGEEDGEEDAEMDAENIVKEMDKDNDGLLTLEELMSVETEEPIPENDKKMMTEAFGIADADKDGKLSVAELPRALQEFEK